MSGWIKIRTDLLDDPDLLILSDIIQTECRTLVGHLVFFWSWVDRHITAGDKIELSKETIDHLIGVPGFTLGMQKIGWISGHDGAYTIPHMERHMSATAKARAMEAEARRIRREACPDGPDNHQTKKAENVGRDKIREDKIKERDGVDPSPPSPPPVPMKKIVELYHQTLPELPACEKLTKKREGQIRQRWKQDLPDLDHWVNYFEFIRASDFLMGRTPPQGGRAPFRADLEWITNESNFAKIAEEKYHDGGRA